MVTDPAESHRIEKRAGRITKYDGSDIKRAIVNSETTSPGIIKKSNAKRTAITRIIIGLFLSRVAIPRKNSPSF
jgi:hypothetical protein